MTWNTPETVTVTAENDSDNAIETVDIIHEVTSTDPDYILSKRVKVTISDDESVPPDAPEIQVTFPANGFARFVPVLPNGYQDNGCTVDTWVLSTTIVDPNNILMGVPQIDSNIGMLDGLNLRLSAGEFANDDQFGLAIAFVSSSLCGNRSANAMVTWMPDGNVINIMPVLMEPHSVQVGSTITLEASTFNRFTSGNFMPEDDQWLVSTFSEALATADVNSTGTISITGVASGLLIIRMEARNDNDQIRIGSLLVKVIPLPAYELAMASPSINENEVSGTLSRLAVVNGGEITSFVVSEEGSPSTNFGVTITATDTTLVVLSTANLNYETKPSHTVTIQGKQANNENIGAELVVTIAINDVNEAPTAIALSQSTLNEGIYTTDANLATLSATNPEGEEDLASYEIVGGADAALFTIAGGGGSPYELRFKSATTVNDAVKDRYEIELQVTDQIGNTFQSAFALTVNDTNGAPTAITLSGRTLNEGIYTTDATLATLTATDPEGEADLTGYEIVGGADAALFTIAGGGGSPYQLRFKSVTTVNDAIKDRYEIELQVTDQIGNTFKSSFSLSVNDTNGSPTAITLSGRTLNEGIYTTDATLATLSATDPEGEEDLTGYEVVGGADAALFAIAGGGGSPYQLRFKSVTTVNDAVKDRYEIELQVTDQIGNTFQSAFALTVNDTNGAPTAITLTQSSPLEENVTYAEQEEAATLTATDTPADDVHTFALVPGSGDEDNATFEVVGNALQFATATTFDFETKSSYSVRLQVEDKIGNIHSGSYLVAISDINEPPTVPILTAPDTPDHLTYSDHTLTLREATPAGIPLLTSTTTDPDAGDLITYELLPVAPSGAGLLDTLTMDATTGTITLNESLNTPENGTYYGKHTFKVVASDGELNAETVAQTLAIDLSAPLGVNGTKTSRYRLYPNPVSGEEHLRITATQSGDQIAVVDMVGRLLISHTVRRSEDEVSVALLPKGSYLVIITPRQGESVVLPLIRQ